MDIRSKFSFNIPEALIEVLGITEDTPFVVSFEDGKLTVEPILDDNEESNDVTVDIESENDAWYEEGYDEGHYDGYTKGYSVGYDDAENGREFNDAYPEDCGIDCDYDCENCRFYNASKDTCEASEEE
jgi:hypothetical protein